MEGFPCIELLDAPRRNDGLQLGMRWPLTGEAVRLGRSSAGAVVLDSQQLARVHLLFEKRADGWWAKQMQGGALVAGVRLTEHKLSHDDVLTLPDGFVLRFLDRAERWPVQPQLEAAALAHPEDRAVWAIYGDWLVEQGVPEGAWLAGAPATEAERARFLGPLAGAFLEGSLSLRWQHGVPVAAVLRSPGFTVTREAPQLFAQVLQWPGLRFLRELTLDVRSLISRGANTAGGLPGEWSALSLLSTLPAQAVHANLRSLAFVPCRPLALEEHGAVQALLSAHLPQLRTPLTHLTGTPSKVTVELLSVPEGVRLRGLRVGMKLMLLRHRANLLGPLPEVELSLGGPPGHALERVGCRIDCDDGQWWLSNLAEEQSPGSRRNVKVLVNGVERARARLHKGDVLEPLPGLRLGFDWLLAP